MPAPTFVAAYNSASYTTTDTPKTVSVTTQAGDLLVVYAGTPDSTCTVNAPSGNGISFTEQQSFFVSGNCSVHLWTGIDSTGGTNWTLTCTRAGSTLMWGFTCVVFRNSAGFGATNGISNQNGSPTLSLTTAANSAVVAFNADWLANGNSRTWKEVNGVTPSVGNGLELTYAWDSVNYTAYGAYYNDTGSAGSNAYGLLLPSPQQYTIVLMEVLAGEGGGATNSVAWLRA